MLRRTFRTVDGRRLHWTIHWLPRLDASILKNSRVAFGADVLIRQALVAT
jgi:hypothetical protein